MADIDSLAIQINSDAGNATSGLNSLADTLKRLQDSVKGISGNMNKIAASLGKLTGALSGANFSALDGVADKIRDIAAAVDSLDGTKLANLAKVAQKFNNVAKSAQNAATAAKQAQQAIDGGMAHQAAGTQAGAIQKTGQAARDAGKDAEKGASGFEKFFDRVKRIATTMLIRAAFKAIIAAFKAGITNLYNWSKAVGTEFAPSMDKIATSAQYLKNSLGAMLAPLINSFAPILDWLIDKLVILINYVNMFFAVITGASTYTRAVKVGKSWGDSVSSSAKGAKKAVDDLKRTILGFDEINKLNGDNGSGGSGGGGGGNSGTDVSGMFEEVPLNNAVFGTGLIEYFSTTLGKINGLIDSSLMAVGLIMLFKGNVPVGLGLMAAGAVDFASTVVAYNDNITPEIKAAIAAIEVALAGGLAAGAILAFSGGNIPLGIGLMAAALASGVGAGKIVTINWDSISNALQGPVGKIAILASGLSLVFGLILLFVPSLLPLAIGLLAAGLAGTVTTVAANWTGIVETLKNKAAEIAGISGIMTVIGILLLFTPLMPLGLGLLAAGVTGLVSAVVVNWNTLTNKISTFATSVAAWFVQAFNDVKDTLVNVGTNIWSWITSFFSGAWDWIKSAAIVIAGFFSLAFTTVKDKIVAVGTTIWGWLTSFFSGAWDWIKGAATDVANFFSLAFTFVKSKIVEIGTNIWNGITSGISTAISSVWNWLKTNVFDPFITAFKSVFGIASPASTMEEPGKNILLGIYEGIKNAIKGVGTWLLLNVFMPIWGAIKKFGSTAIEFVVSLAKKVGEWASDVWDFIVAGVNLFTTTLQATFSSIGDWATDTWDQIKAGSETIEKSLNATFSAVSGWAQDLWDSITKEWNDFISGKWLGIKVKRDNDPDGDNNDLNGGDEPYAGPGVLGTLNSMFNPGYRIAAGVSSIVANNTRQGLISNQPFNAKIKTLEVGTVEAGAVDTSRITEADLSGTNSYSLAGFEEDTTINALVEFSPADSNAKGYKNSDGLKRYLGDTFKGGTNTKVTANLKRGDKTVADVFGTSLTVTGTLKKAGQTLASVFGDKLTITGTLVKPSKFKMSDVFGNVLDVLGNLSGIKKGSSTIGGLFGTVLTVLGLLSGDPKKGSATIISLFGNLLTVIGQLDGKPKSGSATIIGLFGNALSVYASLFKNTNNKAEPKDFWANAIDVVANLVKGSSTPASLYGTSMKIQVELVKKPGNKIEWTGVDAQNNKFVWYAQKNGGVFQNGAWSGIPQYAGGALNAGSMFIAGEAGPELVGHIGGRTEVLNKSQLAAAMYSAVSAAMAPAAINFAYAAQRMEEDDGADNSAILDLLRQQNDYLRRINDKEFTAEITASDIARGQARMNRRAGTTIIPVATP